MKEFSFLMLAVFLFCFNALGQGKIELLGSGHDFGNIKESDGPVIYQFEFMNVGDLPIVIKNIKASCGCTTPAWSKDSIPSGEKGFFQAQYNPKNRPGPFRKTLTITINGNPTVLKAYISGTVEPKQKSIQEKMPVKIGATRLKSRTINLGRSVNQGVINADFDIFNDSEDTLALSNKYDAPDFIKLIYEDTILNPGAVTNISLIYDTEHEDNLGMQSHGIKIYTNESEYAGKKMDVMITLKEYFAEMTEEELLKSPKLHIHERLKNIGNVSQDESTSVEFIITNTGKGKLEIRKLESNCACLVPEVTDRTIKSGGSAKIIARFNSVNRRGVQNKSIFIYTNDPSDPTQVISVRASVTQKK